MYATVHQFFILRIHLIELQILIVDEGTLRYCGNGWVPEAEGIDASGCKIINKATHCSCKTDLCNGSNELISGNDYVIIIVVSLISYLFK